MTDLAAILSGLEAGITDHREARAHKMKEAAALILAMAARIEELEKALEPFAKAADELIPGTPDEAGVMWDGIVAMANAGHLRTAARALRGEG
jgi:hypothetical protein